MEFGIDALGKFEALKAFTMGGVEYRPGDVVDFSTIPGNRTGKIRQLLDQRFIIPHQEKPATGPE